MVISDNIDCGLSDEPCDDYYQGPSPASEVETQNVVRAISQIQNEQGE